MFHRTPPAAASENILMKIQLLALFFFALKEEASDANCEKNIEVVLNFELPIAAEIALPTQNEIFKLNQFLSHLFITFITNF